MVKSSVVFPCFVVAFALAAHAAAATQEQVGPAPSGSVVLAAQAASGEAPAEPPSGVVNVNTATTQQLQLLPGIGPSRAQAIIERREQHPFRRPEDLLAIRGIGRATLNRMLPYVVLEGDTTLTRPVPSGRTRSSRQP
jgi:competence protein ComEA